MHSLPRDPLPVGYTLTDTSDWGNPLEEGTRALLRRTGTLIDTVDLAFGVMVVGLDCLVFLPVRTDTVPIVIDDKTTFYENFTTEAVLWTPHERRELRHVIPYFHSYFSSASKAQTSSLYYWGIAPRDSTNHVYVIRYDFRTRRLDSLLVGEDGLNTDYRYYFGLPHEVDGDVAFDSFLVDRSTWRLVERAAPSN